MKKSGQFGFASVFITGLMVASTSLLSTLAGAVEVSSPETNRIVVTALRIPADEMAVPYSIYKLDAKEAQSHKATKSTPEVFQGLPSVMGQKTANGQGSPHFRGFTGFRNLFMIDGVRLNNSVFRDGPNQYWNTVDLLSLSTLDAVMGPASVLYGSDAIGGTVNALTTPSPAYAGKPEYEGRMVYRGASAERSTIGRIQIGARPSEEVGFIGGVTVRNYGDLRGGSEVGRQSHTGYDELDFDGRADFAVSKDHTITYGHQSVSQDDVWRTHKTIYGLDWEGCSVGNEKQRSLDQHRCLDYLKYKGANLDSFADSMELTISRQNQQEDEFRIKPDLTREAQGLDVTTLGTALQLESDTAFGNWVYGAEYYHDSVDSYLDKYKANGKFSKSDIQGPVADDATYDAFGLYLQDTISLLDEQLDVIPGARYTFCSADANRVKDPVSGKATTLAGDWDTVAGSLRLLHPLTRDRRHIVFTGVSQGFRAPNLSDLTRFDTARSNEIETPVKDLDPEHFLSYEAGLKSRLDSFAFALTYYYTHIEDMIVRAPTGRSLDGLLEVTKKNSGDGYVQGVEWSSSLTLSQNWSTWLAASWMDGEVESYPSSKPQTSREYLSRLMPPMAQWGVRCQTDNATYWIEGVCDAAEKADKLSADDVRDTQRIPPGGTPGYAVFGTRVGAQVTANLALTLGVENIFDQDYRIHGSGVNEAGRNFVATADYSF
jgi:hemoglobin/transferrin/lactoferrin receptor protein